MKIFNDNRNNIKSHKKNISCNFELPPTYKISKKEEFLDKTKSSLETLLEIIKNSEMSLLTINIPNNKLIKTLLLKLIKNLNYLLEEQNSEIDYFKKRISKKRNILQNQIFIDYKNEQLKKKQYVKGKKINIYNLNSELILLKLLNFKIENDIELINNKLYILTNDDNYLDEDKKYLNMKEKMSGKAGQLQARKQILVKPKQYPLVNKLLNKKIDKISKIFEELVSSKKSENEEIENTINDLNKLENKIIIKNGKIKKESKRLYKNLNIERMNENLNKIIEKYNKNKVGVDKIKKYNDNIIIVETESYKDDVNNSSSFIDSSSLSSFSIKNTNHIKNDFNQSHINLNFNLNINLYKIYHFQDKMAYYSERNDKKEKFHFLYDIKRKKGLSSTKALKTFTFNIIKDNLKTHSKNNENKFNNINYFDKENEIYNEKEYHITV